MSVLWTSATAAQATGGRKNGPDWQAGGVSIDTRTLSPGDLFVALTDMRDGHDFVADALSKGAAAALVARIPDGVAADAPLLLVDDPLVALCDLARAARARMSGKVIAVTGSVGKTGTKEMLRSALNGQGRVHAAERSFNNHWGVPLTLARMPKDTDFAVIEIGMNAPNEITPLSKLARPHVAVITTVAKVHMAAFRNIRGIARAKAEIFDGLEPGGVAVLNRDTFTYPILSRAAKRAGAEQVRFGMSGRPEYVLSSLRLGDNDTNVVARHKRQKFVFKINAMGGHLAMNGLAALAAADAAGADLARSIIGLRDWRPPEGRGARFAITLDPDTGQGPASILLIDESYNANPTSMEAALATLAATPVTDGVGRVAKGRRIAVLGDMLELGAEEQQMHASLARLPAFSKIDKVHFVGPRMGALKDALDPRQHGIHADNAADLAAQIGRTLDAGDVIMVKASLGTGLKAVVEAIKVLDHRGTETD